MVDKRHEPSARNSALEHVAVAADRDSSLMRQTGQRKTASRTEIDRQTEEERRGRRYTGGGRFVKSSHRSDESVSLLYDSIRYDTIIVFIIIPGKYTQYEFNVVYNVFACCGRPA